jgi:fructose-specific phosphotransferase system IIC component
MADINSLYIGVLIVAVIIRFALMPGSIKSILPSIEEGNLNFLGTLITGLIAGYGILTAYGDLSIFTLGQALVVFIAVYGSPTLFDRALTLVTSSNTEDSKEQEPVTTDNASPAEPSDDDDTA